MTLPIVERLRLRFRHSAYLATTAPLHPDPDCKEAADTIEELVGVVTRCQRFFVSNWSAEEAVACDQAVNTVLAKIGGTK